MNKKIVVAILLLCIALSMGCSDTYTERKSVYVEKMEQTYVQESDEKKMNVSEFREYYNIPDNYSYPITLPVIKVSPK